jgi:feruloyl esterase
MQSIALAGLPDTIIESAQTTSGTFTPPDGTAPIPGLPSFCRVTAKYAPSAVSDIQIEVWLPSTGWNGRLQGVGNGGLAGSITYTALAPAIMTGYASVSTDTGHVASDTTWLAIPDKERDNGYRAIHGMTLIAKAVVQQFYSSAPQASYFNGCSTGGGQGFGEVQLYPDDYDGVLAGAPQDFATHIRATAIWNGKATLDDPASYIPPAKLPQITAAVLAHCGTPAEVADGFLQNPQLCRFDPFLLSCAAGQDPTTSACFSPPQITAIRKLYQGSVETDTHELIWPGYEPGSEGPVNSSGGGTVSWATETAGPLPFSAGTTFYSYAVFDNPKFDFHIMNFTSDVQKADQEYPYLNHHSLDLSGYIGLGHKLLVYHGFDDPLLATQSTINYYGSLVHRIGEDHHIDDFNQALRATQQSVRLFMVPGMGHCGGGPGPVSFDALTPLVNWVEKGQQPKTILASHIDATSKQTIFTRPLCPYPQEAAYIGSGDRTNAANWSCKDQPFTFDPRFFIDGANIYSQSTATDRVQHPLLEYPVNE